MGYATRLGPLAMGTVKEGSGYNLADPPILAVATITFTDTTAKNLFILPAGSMITNIRSDVVTAFNAGTTNTFNLGKTGSAAFFVSGAAIGPIGHSGMTFVAANLAGMVNTGLTDVQVIGTYVPTGTAATTGLAYISVEYIMRNPDGTSIPVP